MRAVVSLCSIVFPVMYARLFLFLTRLFQHPLQTTRIAHRAPVDGAQVGCFSGVPSRLSPAPPQCPVMFVGIYVSEVLQHVLLQLDDLCRRAREPYGLYECFHDLFVLCFCPSLFQIMFTLIVFFLPNAWDWLHVIRNVPNWV